MYKYETHMHTAETSACASAAGEQQARRYKELGYDGIIITDHFFNGNCHESIKNCKDWYKKVDMFMSGYDAAKAEGDRIGLKVFFGLEYCYCGADLLTYGVDREWLYAHPEVISLSVFDYAGLVHDSGGVLVHAHPFREAGYLNEIRLVPHYVDGVESYNCGNASEVYNERAKWYAESFGFVQTGGTDNHHLSAERLSGIYTQTPLESIDDYVQAIKTNNIAGIIYPEKLKN